MNVTHPAAQQVRSPGIAHWLIAQQRFFRWALLLSVGLHLGLLAWHRVSPPVPTPQPTELEIVMVNAATESEPNQAKLLAQSNTDGGGAAANGYTATSVPHAGEAAEPILLETLIQQRQQLELQQQQLLTQLVSQQKVAQGRPALEPAESSDLTGEDETDQDSIVLNRKIAVLSQKIQEENARPRQHFDSPSTRKTAFVPYIDQWRQRVELVGTQHYPTGVGGKSYGSVQATLTIRADGTIADITINRPSNQAILNQAVRRIAQLSAPFAPFPPDMARQIDQLVLTRTWHFVNGALETRAP